MNPLLRFFAKTRLPLSMGLCAIGPSALVSEPPKIHIEQSDDITYIQGDRIHIRASATDLDGSVQSVSFFLDGEFQYADATAPYEWIWEVNEIGRFEIRASAIDDSEEVSDDIVTARAEVMSAKNLLPDPRHYRVLDVVSVDDIVFALFSDGCVYQSQDLVDWKICYDPVHGVANGLLSGNGYVYTRNGYYCNVAEGGEWQFANPPTGSFYELDSIGKYFVKRFGTELWVTEDFRQWTSLRDVSQGMGRVLCEFNGDLVIQKVGSMDEPFDAFFLFNPETGLRESAAPIVASLKDALYRDGVLILLMREYNGPNRIFSTSDGTVWQEHPIVLESGETTGLFITLESYGDLLMLEADRGRPSAVVARSLDETWRNTSADGFEDRLEFEEIYENDGVYYSNVNIGGSRLVTSTDGITWSRFSDTFDFGSEFVLNSSGLAIEYAYGHLFIHGYDGERRFVNGDQILEVPLPEAGSGYIVEIVKTESQYVAFTTRCFLVSEDGKEWRKMEKPEDLEGWFCYGNGVFLGSREDGSVLASRDLVNWDVVSLPDLPKGSQDPIFSKAVGAFVIDLSSIYYTERQYLTSRNGYDWTLREMSDLEPSRFYDAGEYLVALCDSVFREPGSYISKNGIDWEFSHKGRIAYSNGVYTSESYAINRDLDEFSSWSKDALNWHSSGQIVREILPIDGGFLSLDGRDQHTAMYSRDGATWVECAMPRIIRRQLGSPGNDRDTFFLSDGVYLGIHGIYRSRDPMAFLRESENGVVFEKSPIVHRMKFSVSQDLRNWEELPTEEGDRLFTREIEFENNVFLKIEE